MGQRVSNVFIRWGLTWAAFCGMAWQLPAEVSAVEPCRIEITDQQNGWPVPLVELTTTHHVRFISDNRGVIAFDLPELMGQETWFSVRGHGYSVAPDGFGYEGVRLVPRPGETLRVKVHRQLPAKRLGRLTGGGLFAECQKLGDEQGWTEQGILGCDSVQNVVHQGKLFWGWGDTTLAHYPLGRFHMIGATTAVSPLSSLAPPIRLRYDYFCDTSGIPRNIAEMPGSGPTWLSGFVSLPDQEGRYRVGATYAKIEPPLTEYERGLCVWDEEQARFVRLRVIWRRDHDQRDPPAAPVGHAVSWTDKEGVVWLLFGDPFPSLQCRARFEDWSDPARWQTLAAQDSVATATSNDSVRPHRGAIAWNAFRRKWVTIFTQLQGDSSYLGEIWYAEAESPTGPWQDAIKVVTHDKYTFYNPQLHPEFAPAESPILLFEGTFTHTFSRTRDPVPRHDYNQVLYRLDLDELP